MEPYAEMVGELGVKAIIGKGECMTKVETLFKVRASVSSGRAGLCSLLADGLRRLRKFTGLI